MTTTIEKNGKYYYIETGYGFDVASSTVTCFDSVDKFGRLLNGVMVFRGHWDDCIRYVNAI